MRNGKKSQAELTPKSSAVDESEDEILTEHIEKLVKAGEVTLGKGGPPLNEMLRPGPRVPNASRAITQDRRKR